MYEFDLSQPLFVVFIQKLGKKDNAAFAASKSEPSDAQLFHIIIVAHLTYRSRVRICYHEYMTLTEVSYYSRKFAPFAVLVLVVMLIMFYTVKLIFLLGTNTGDMPIAIDPAFKELKPIEVTNASGSGKFSYVIDTVDGEPVTATEAAKVYLLPKSPFRFGYKEKMYLMAKKFGFDDGVTHRLVDKTIALFEDGKRKFRIDITNFNFKYDQDITSSPELFVRNGTPNKEDAQNRAVDFLKSFDRYPDDLAKGRMNVIFLQYDKVSSKTAVLEDSVGANMVEVDFYRADVDSFPIVSNTYFNSPNYVTMVESNGNYEVVSARINIFEKSQEQYGVYPVLDGHSAFEKLATGSGYIVSGAQIPKKEIAIKRMFLGYYDPEVYQDYLQPVYVFLGDDNFVAYVPAVTDRWLIDYSKL